MNDVWIGCWDDERVCAAVGRYCWVNPHHFQFDHLRGQIFLLLWPDARVVACAALLWSQSETGTLSPRSGLLVERLPDALSVNIYAPVASHDCNQIRSHPLLMIRIRIQFRFSRLSRQYHNQGPSQPFNILYFGRDEFSCQVLEKLYSATGSTFPHHSNSN